MEHTEKTSDEHMDASHHRCRAPIFASPSVNLFEIVFFDQQKYHWVSIIPIFLALLMIFTIECHNLLKCNGSVASSLC